MDTWIVGSLALAITALLAWLPNRNTKIVEASQDVVEGMAKLLEETRTAKVDAEQARDQARQEVERFRVLLETRDGEIRDLRDQNTVQRQDMDAMARQIARLETKLGGQDAGN